jgi:L-ascorbate metabolism protein UlaG (beta-lactamase superfamily)
MKEPVAIILSISGLVAAAALILWNLPEFGSAPCGERLARIKKSPNYKNGEFQNLLPTPIITEAPNEKHSAIDIFFSAQTRRTPQDAIPSVKRDLLHLDPARNILVWFGHSSYFMQLEGKRILVDPVFSGHASPLSFLIKAFRGTDAYSAADLPDIDYLFITHDHWDHLDYDTVKKLRPRVGKVICGLGVGAHLERWGYSKEQIIEGDWGDEENLGGGFAAYVLPARHFSGRRLERNKTLWASFALVSPRGAKIYMGGDSGYGPHFAAIGKAFGGFDLAVLEDGQYDPSWKYIHMTPSETLLAARDLDAKILLPVHNSKFMLSTHNWDTPLKAITALAKETPQPVITPEIGEIVNLDNPAQSSSEWWNGIK